MNRWPWRRGGEQDKDVEETLELLRSVREFSDQVQQERCVNTDQLDELRTKVNRIIRPAPTWERLYGGER